MTSRRKTVSVPRTEAALYVGKAEQFMIEARAASDASRNDAAVLNAIHAAISATDAVTTALVGRRSADPDHQRAADLLEEAAGPSDEIGAHARQLRSLLAMKNAVEYESRRATRTDAARAVKQAARMVAWAVEVVKRARL